MRAKTEHTKPVSLLAERSAVLPTSLWMVPYADLMSTMVILFLALFAYSYGQRSPEYEAAVSKMQEEMAGKSTVAAAGARAREAELAMEIQKTLAGLALRDFGVRITARYIHLRLPSPVLFREGSARLSSQASRILVPLSRILARVPNPVLIAGHTDNLRIVGGRYKSNWELSAARAFSVIRFMAGKKLPPRRFHARGYGEFRPIASNDTAQGRRRNRRIEISLVRAVERGE